MYIHIICIFIESDTYIALQLRHLDRSACAPESIWKYWQKGIQFLHDGEMSVNSLSGRRFFDLAVS